MKKHLLFASLLISSFAFAQNKTSFNIKAGVVNAGIKGEASNSLNDIINYTGGMVTTSNRTGFFAGGSIQIPVTDQISIEPGVSYTQRGYEVKGGISLKNIDFLGVNAKAQLTSHYIDIPLLVKADLGGFQVFAGPQVSYLAQADLRTTAGALGFNVLNKTMDATEQMNRWDAGLTGGIGYQFGNGFQVMAAYDHGLTKLDANRNMDAYNRSFKAGVGFRF
ncbi:MAG: porin family protein [Chitinophagaceae bacterium]